MYVEYCNYNRYIEDYSKELSEVFLAIENEFNGLALPIHMIREIREYMPDGLVLAAPIDYPSGYSSTKVRIHSVINYCQSGANAIDLVPNQYLLRCKYKDLKSEISTAINICKDYGATLRIFLDYHNVSNVVRFAKMCYDVGVEIAFPTIGYHHDDFFDNLITAKVIDEETEMSTIFNGYMWTKEHVKFAASANLFGIRLYNHKLWCNKVI